MQAPAVVDVLRHGDTGFAGFRGTLDDTLTPLGWQQMRDAVAGQTWDAVVSSPRLRCAAFARDLALRLDTPLELDERLAELDFGAWEGKTVAQVLERDADALHAFWNDPEHHAPPGGETLGAFNLRVRQAWRELVQRHAGRRVLVVTHGGVIRRLLCDARGLPPGQLLALEVPHGSMHRLADGPESAT